MYRVKIFEGGIADTKPLEVYASHVSFVNNASFGPVTNFGLDDDDSELGESIVLVNIHNVAVVEVEITG